MYRLNCYRTALLHHQCNLFMLRLFATDKMNADKDVSFSALLGYLGALERNKTSSENCIAISNNV